MADLSQDDLERTEQPTPLRLAEARRRGLAPRSADLTAVAVLGAGCLALALTGSSLLESLRRLMAAMLDGGACPLAGPADAANLLWRNLLGVLALLGPVVLAMVVAALAANAAQVGALWAWQAMAPDFGRLSPAAGLRRLGGGRAGVRLLMAAAKIAAVVAVCVAMTAGTWRAVLAASASDSRGLVLAAGGLAARLTLRLALAMGVLAVTDLIYQRWQFRRDLRITRRQLLEDIRSMEGDRRVHARQRRKLAALRAAAKRDSASAGLRAAASG